MAYAFFLSLSCGLKLTPFVLILSPGKYGSGQPEYRLHANRNHEKGQVIGTEFGDVIQCAAACKGTVGCTGFVYDRSRGGCDLMASMGSPSKSVGVDTWVACGRD